MKKIFVLFLFILFNCPAYSANPLVAFKVDNFWYFLNESGKELFKPMILDGVGSYSEGKLFVKKRDKDTSYFCYIDHNGRELFKVNTSLPFNFNYDRALTVRFLDEEGMERLYGFIDDKGKVIFENELYDALDFSDSLAYIMKEDIKGYIGIDGQFRFLIDWEVVGYRFAEGLAPVSNNDYLFGFIDKTGKLVIPFRFDEAGEFREGLCKVYYKGDFGFINRNGDFVIHHRYDDVRDFSEGYAFVAKFDSAYVHHWGFINKDGRLIEDYIYSRVHNFSEGLAAVQKNSKWGFIDYDGNTIIDFQFNAADSFKNGIAFAMDRDNKRAGFINKKGEFVIQLKKFDILVELRSNLRYYSFE